VPESRYKPDGKWVVQALDHKFAPFDDDASPRRWRSFSPQMWANYLGWVRGLQQRALWTSYPDNLYDTLADYMLEEDPTAECPDCPDCPPEPEPPPPPKPGSGAAAVGRLGMTLEELEGLLMSSIMDIRINGSKLEVQYFPCCDWVPVGDIASIASATQSAPTTFGTVAAIANGIANLANTLPTLTPVPNSTEAFNNEWTRKCLKATALKYVLQTLYADIGDSAADIPSTGWAVFMASVSAALSVTPLKGLVPVANAASWVTKWGADFLVGEIDDLLANSAAWDNFVCNFADVMTGVETFTGQDISNFYAKAVTYTALFAEWAFDLLDNIVPTEFQARVNENISAVSCECSGYLPAGYTPPLGVGTLRISRIYFCNQPDGASSYAPTFTAGVKDVAHNAPSGTAVGQFPKTAYHDTASSYYQNKFAVMLEVEGGLDFSLGAVRADLVYDSGEPAQIDWSFSAYREDTDVWANFGAIAQDTAPINTALLKTGTSIPTVSRICISTLMPNPVSDGVPKLATFNNLRFDGTFMGIGFTDLKVGDSFTP